MCRECNENRKFYLLPSDQSEKRVIRAEGIVEAFEEAEKYELAGELVWVMGPVSHHHASDE